MPDPGLTHVALTARDLDASVAFYGKYGGMAVVHRRVREGVRSVWLSDHTRPFVLAMAILPPEQLAAFLKRTSDRELEAIEHDWGWGGGPTNRRRKAIGGPGFC